MVPPDGSMSIDDLVRHTAMRTKFLDDIFEEQSQHIRQIVIAGCGGDSRSRRLRSRSSSVVYEIDQAEVLPYMALFLYTHNPSPPPRCSPSVIVFFPRCPHPWCPVSSPRSSPSLRTCQTRRGQKFFVVPASPPANHLSGSLRAWSDPGSAPLTPALVGDVHVSRPGCPLLPGPQHSLRSGVLHCRVCAAFSVPVAYPLRSDTLDSNLTTANPLSRPVLAAWSKYGTAPHAGVDWPENLLALFGFDVVVGQGGGV